MHRAGHAPLDQQWHSGHSALRKTLDVVPFVWEQWGNLKLLDIRF